LPKALLFIYAFLLSCLVWAVGTSIWIYDKHRHEHVERMEGDVFRKDDVVVDAFQSFKRDGREKVVCYRESHRNFYIFIFQMTLGILAVTVAGVVVNFRLNNKLRKKNGQVLAQKSELEIQKRAVDEANTQVMASLRYAEKLQTGILMRHEDLVAAHPRAFLFNKPKAAIGGDFCYSFTDGTHRIICVGDCTGHGVPGAILAVLAFTLIRQIVEEGELEPERIVDLFRTRFAQRLWHGQNDDKAEIMVCRIHEWEGTLLYAANGARAYWTDGQRHALLEGTGTAMVPKGSYLYFFSDGYADQLGGPDNKRLLRKRFLALLEELAHVPAQEQPSLLDARLVAWQGAEVQTDDVIVLGWPI
jgi:serine phosphatase RsbU (regulator of sigma subunit)